MFNNILESILHQQQWSPGIRETRPVPRQDQTTFGSQLGKQDSRDARGVRLRVELGLCQTISTSEEIPEHGRRMGRPFGRLCQGHGYQTGND